MTSPSWLYRDMLQDMGIGPKDFEPDRTPPPSEIVVNYLVPVSYEHDIYGCVIIDRARLFRAFPMFMAAAAERFRQYAERKYGKGNVWEEYD